jgi:alpha-tubulin suppressor-like RCC1 family protein
VLLADGGGVLSFGGNANGELGREGGTWAPGRVAALDGARVAQLAAGGFHSAALTADGEVRLRCASARVVHLLCVHELHE